MGPLLKYLSVNNSVGFGIALDNITVSTVYIYSIRHLFSLIHSFCYVLLLIQPKRAIHSLP